MKDSEGALTPKQERALAALISEGTIKEAAKVSGTSETTLWRWMQIPEFQKRHRAAQREVVDAAIGELQGATTEAARTLKRNLTCGNSFAENTAAITILNQSLKAVEMQEMLERIERLEERIADREKGNKRWG